MDISSSSKGFEGVIIVRDPNNFRAAATPLEYKDTGEFALRGFVNFVNIEGNLLLRGTSNTLSTSDVINRPGFYAMKLWSRRELHE
jgi:hypothetical protein